MKDFDLTELEGEGVFDDDPTQQLAGWQRLFDGLQQEWQFIRARYKLARELGNDEQAERIMEDARKISEAGGKVKARIEELENPAG